MTTPEADAKVARNMWATAHRRLEAANELLKHGLYDDAVTQAMMD